GGYQLLAFPAPGVGRPDNPDPKNRNILPDNPTNFIVLLDAPGLSKGAPDRFPFSYHTRFLVTVSSRTIKQLVGGIVYDVVIIASAQGVATKNALNEIASQTFPPKE